MLVGVLRYVHVQRSTIEEVTDTMIRGLASRSKSRVKGKRRPFQWSAPCKGLSGFDLGTHIQSYLRHAAARQPLPRFILFDFLPARTPLSAVSAFAPAAMSMSRFLYFSSSLFESDPLRLSKHEVSEITTYSARRVLPSIADAAGLSVTERLAVGGWSDSAPDGSSMSTHARRMAMPVRYSEQKLVVAASIRSDLVVRAKAAIDLYTASHPSVSSPKWDHVLSWLPKRHEQSAHLNQDSLPKRLEQSAPSGLGSFHGGCSLERLEQCALVASNTTTHSTTAIVWVHARSRGRVLHRRRAGPGDSSSSVSETVRTICGRVLADCVSGSGDPPVDRLWCRDCMPTHSSS